MSVYGVGEEAGTYYYAMQFIDGRTLDTVLQAIRRFRANKTIPSSNRQDDLELADSITQGLLAGCFSDPGNEGERAPSRECLEGKSTAPTLLFEKEGTSDAHIEQDGSWADPLSSQIGTPYYHRVAQVGLQVAEALAYAHEQGVLHRDIKPSNLLLDSAGRVWVTDFGLAKAEDGEALTRTGDFVGTLRYMAPERFQGHSGPRGDVYGLGATLYELLTLRPAFDDEDRPRLIARIARESPPALRTLDSEIPRDLETIVLKAMAREAADRYASAAALAEDLRRLLAGRAILARSASSAEKLWRWSRRNPVVAILGTAVGALLIVIAVGMSVSALRSRERAEREAGLRDRAERSEAELRAANSDLVRSLYFQRIALAQGALSIGNLDHAADLLEEGCPETLRGWEWNYLRRLHLDKPLTLRGGARAPLFVTFSPDNRLLVTPKLGRDGELSIREVGSGKEVRCLTGRGGSVRDAAFLADGKHVVSASQWANTTDHVDGCEVVTWDIESGKALQIHSIPVNTDLFHFKAVFSADGRELALGTFDGNQAIVFVHDVATGRSRCALRGHLGGVSALAFSHNGRLIATASEDRSTKIWDVDTGQQIRTLRHGNEPPTGVAFSRDGTRFATASFYGTVTVWETSTGKKISKFLGHDAPIGGLAFHPDGDRLVSAGEDGTVRIWFAETGHELLFIKGFPGVEPRVGFSPDGRRLSAVNWDLNYAEDGGVLSVAEIRILDGSPTEARSKSPLLVLRGHREGVICLAFGPDHRSLASGDDGGTVRLWDLASERVMAVLKGHDAPVTRVAFTPDGSRLASATEQGVIKLWDVGTGEMLKTISATRHRGCVVNLAFSPDGGRLASAHEGSRGGVWIWEVATGRELHALQGHSFGAWGAVFSGDGNRLITVGGEAAVKTWDARAGREILTVRLSGSINHSGRSVAVAFNHDVSRVTRSTYDRTVGIWNVANGEELAILERNTNEAWSVEYSPDGRRIATANWATSKIWDAATGQLLLTLRGHGDRVRGVAFSPDGDRLASASMDKSVMIWRLPP